MWWGLYLIACGLQFGVYFFFSALICNLSLRYGVGVPLLEKKYKNNPEFEEYCKETNCFVHYEEIGKDADQRDYEVSYDKLEAEGFKCDVDMKTGINELIKVAPILQIRHQYS